MDIEEAIDRIKRIIKITYTKEFATFELMYQDTDAIETLLTAYEKEKGENVKLRLQDIPLIEGELKAYKDRVNELKAELEKEKEERERIGKLYYEANENCIDYEKMIKKEKEKNKELEDTLKQTQNSWYEDTKVIEKQSKEIEELKEERKKYPIAMNDEQYKKVIELAQKDIKEELDRQINTKIEECENKIKKIRSKKLINEPEDTIVITRYAHYISVLQSLLEKE